MKIQIWEIAVKSPPIICRSAGPSVRAGLTEDDIARKFFARHLLVEEHRKAHGGVDMAARDVADGVRHRHDDETERERRCNDAVVAFAPRCDCDAAAEDDKDHGADKFGDTFLDHRFGAMGFFAEFFGR